MQDATYNMQYNIHLLGTKQIVTEDLHTLFEEGRGLGCNVYRYGVADPFLNHILTKQKNSRLMEMNLVLFLSQNHCLNLFQGLINLRKY